MEKKYFSFLIVVFFLFLGCAGLNRSATVTMLSAPVESVVFDKSVEIEILTETPEFTEEDEKLLRCLTIAGLQERGLQTPVSEEAAAKCNSLIESKGDVRYFWKKMGFENFECKPQVPLVDAKPLLLKIRVLEMKRGNELGHFLFGGLAGRPGIRFEITAGVLAAVIEAKAPQTTKGNGLSVLYTNIQTNSFGGALLEGAQKVVETIP